MNRTMEETHLKEVEKHFTTSEFWKFIGLELLEFGEGRIKLGLPYKKEFDNVRDTVHGGIYMAVLDTTMGMFCRSLGFNDVITIQMNTQFLKPVIEGDITATAALISQSRTTALVEGRLFDEGGELIGFSTATFKTVK
ncbi:PaaI family thioesterase [Sporosarcina sp. 179-K 3D1 HS]|uniref:PaaI family thioesterase n=1 Tax=Sporosarcina sp. 179-K 3D1 HS TaxID=3232169 RepID=UPI0039A2C197